MDVHFSMDFFFKLTAAYALMQLLKFLTHVFIRITVI